MASKSVARLSDHLASVPPGLIEDIQSLESLLVDCWPDLDGSGGEGMYASKLRGRMESVKWNPPILSFEIERHGGAVMGSTRAALHEWKVDVQLGTAAVCPTGRFRGLRPSSARWDAKAKADEIVRLILNGVDDSQLKWDRDKSRITIRLQGIVPYGGGQRTYEGRRKRLLAALGERIEHTEWSKVPNGSFHTFEHV